MYKLREALDAICDAITAALAEGESVDLCGIGKFHVVVRARKSGRNPRTGERMDIPARRMPAFKPGKKLVDAVREEVED